MPEPDVGEPVGQHGVRLVAVPLGLGQRAGRPVVEGQAVLGQPRPRPHLHAEGSGVRSPDLSQTGISLGTGTHVSFVNTGGCWILKWVGDMVT